MFSLFQILFQVFLWLACLVSRSFWCGGLRYSTTQQGQSKSCKKNLVCKKYHVHHLLRHQHGLQNCWNISWVFAYTGHVSHVSSNVHMSCKCCWLYLVILKSGFGFLRSSLYPVFKEPRSKSNAVLSANSTSGVQKKRPAQLDETTLCPAWHCFKGTTTKRCDCSWWQSHSEVVSKMLLKKWS